MGAVRRSPDNLESDHPRQTSRGGRGHRSTPDLDRGHRVRPRLARRRERRAPPCSCPSPPMRATRARRWPVAEQSPPLRPAGVSLFGSSCPCRTWLPLEMAAGITGARLRPPAWLPGGRRGYFRAKNRGGSPGLDAPTSIEGRPAARGIPVGCGLGRAGVGGGDAGKKKKNACGMASVRDVGWSNAVKNIHGRKCSIGSINGWMSMRSYHRAHPTISHIYIYIDVNFLPRG
jgi:hypothetical protein